MPEDFTAFLGFDEIRERIEQLVLDHDGRGGPPGGFDIFGSRHGNWLTPVADFVSGQHGTVRIDLTNRRPSGNVVVREDREHAADGQGRSDIDALDPGVTVRRAARCSPQHPPVLEVGGVGESALDFGDPVRTGYRLTDSALNSGFGGRSHELSSPTRDATARSTAP